MPTKKTKSKSDQGAKARGADKGVDQAEIDRIVAAIVGGLDKLAGAEGDTVLRLTDLGRELKNLREVVKPEQKWTELVESIQAGTPSGKFLHPRTARRLVQLGKSWWAQTGTDGSDAQTGTDGSDAQTETLGPDIAVLLPLDIQKLTWLCKLSHKQLQAFVTDHDCKGVSRQAIIDDVKKVLGQQKSAASVPSPLAKALSTAVRGLGKVAELAQESSPGSVDPDEVRALKAKFDAAYALLPIGEESEEEDDSGDDEPEIPFRRARTPARPRAPWAPAPAVAASSSEARP
jgi:hypothetical protein